MILQKREKILITGCGGMLGEAVYGQLKDKYNVHATDIDLNEPWLEYLDVRDSGEVKKYVSRVRPDFIVHLAALTDMEYCETHPREAYSTNTEGTKNMVNSVKELGIPLIYICTAGIFRGDKDEYDETDKPEPLSIYGKSKYEGELATRSWDESIVIRAGWMIGGGPKKDKKFVNKIVKQLNNGVSQLVVVDDKLGTPTYTYDLAKVIQYLLEKRYYGLYHGVCDGIGGSRYDVAVAILNSLGLADKIKIKIVNSDYFKKDYFAPRPPSERLNNHKLKSINSALTRDWHECLDEYLKKFDWMSPGKNR